ncbi:Up in starvation [Dimargaris verticillata]|uniref:Up in starvation n=1 Tax=Dimargaris verticillata TaxID=2761393 RepID=A0A9W8EDR7_9FUNG|nr:Up in starvation [Dimargaris verticillata]
MEPLSADYRPTEPFANPTAAYSPKDSTKPSPLMVTHPLQEPPSPFSRPRADTLPDCTARPRLSLLTIPNTDLELLDKSPIRSATSPRRRTRMASMSATGSPEPYPAANSRGSSPLSTQGRKSGKLKSAQATGTATHIPGKGKVFQCSYPNCTMVFTRSEHLARHSRKHTGEKPFQCIIPGCNRIFSRFDNMMQHTQTHQRDGKQSSISSIANASTRVRGRRSISKTDTMPKFLASDDDPDPTSRRLSRMCIQPGELANSTLILRPITSDLVLGQANLSPTHDAKRNRTQDSGKNDNAAEDTQSPGTDGSANGGEGTGSDGDDRANGGKPGLRRSFSISSQQPLLARTSTSTSKGRRSHTLPSSAIRPLLTCLEPNPVYNGVAPHGSQYPKPASAPFAPPGPSPVAIGPQGGVAEAASNNQPMGSSAMVYHAPAMSDPVFPTHSGPPPFPRSSVRSSLSGNIYPGTYQHGLPKDSPRLHGYGAEVPSHSLPKGSKMAAPAFAATPPAYPTQPLVGGEHYHPYYQRHHTAPEGNVKATGLYPKSLGLRSNLAPGHRVASSPLSRPPSNAMAAALQAQERSCPAPGPGPGLGHRPVGPGPYQTTSHPPPLHPHGSPGSGAYYPPGSGNPQQLTSQGYSHHMPYQTTSQQPSPAGMPFSIASRGH